MKNDTLAERLPLQRPVERHFAVVGTQAAAYLDRSGKLRFNERKGAVIEKINSQVRFIK